jgi:hypothetical protein
MSFTSNGIKPMFYNYKKKTIKAQRTHRKALIINALHSSELHAVGRKKFQSDTNSIIIEIVLLEGLEIN